MTVNDVIKALEKWDGDMPVVVQINDCWHGITYIDWSDTNAGPMIVVVPKERAGQ